MIGSAASSGAILAGDDHVRQSIERILATPIGTRVMRRDFGSHLHALIGRPLTPQLVGQVYAATALALLRWEPRRSLRRVALDLAAWAAGRCVITLETERRGAGPRTPETLTLEISATNTGRPDTGNAAA